MLELLQTDVVDRLKGAYLAIVMENDGSMPRHRGAHMLYLSDGTFAGTIGGGNIERLVQADMQKLAEEALGQNSLRWYTQKETHMACGGSALVGILAVDAALEAVIKKLYQNLKEGKSSLLSVSWTNDMQATYSVSESKARISKSSWDNIQKCYTEVIAPSACVYIFGAGHVGQALSPLLKPLQFQQVVLDNREEFAQASRFPDARAVLCADYKDCLQALCKQGLLPKENDFVVILTHGHLGDADVLAEVSKLKLAYVGCIGSRKKRVVVEKNLLARGCTPDFFEKVHLPIGEAILAQTPEEIAISIVSQLIKVRASL